MGLNGSTGKRRHQRRRRGQQRRRAAAGVPVGSERLEDRTLFAAAPNSFGTPVDLTWKGQAVSAYQNQWVVDTGSVAGFRKLAAQQGFTGLQNLGGSGYYQFTSTATTQRLARLAAAHPVALARLQPNMVVAAASIQPNDPGYAQQWGLNNSGQLESYPYNLNPIVSPYDQQVFPNGIPGGAATDFPSPPYPNDNHYGLAGSDVNAKDAWSITTGSKSVVVAVLDTGIDLTHPDLINNIWNNPLDTAANGYNGDGYPGDLHGYNFVANSSDPTDDEGHGTNVAGIIGASGNDGQGVTGVNWNVSLVAVKVLDASGAGSSASIVAGVNYVVNLKAHGINVVAMNESLGGSGYPTDVLESDAIRQAGKAGIIDVLAAGNNSGNNDRVVFDPAAFEASIPTVIAVAAVDNQFNIAAFSNFGAQTVDLAAPGVNIYSTAPTYPVAETNALFNANEPAYYNPPVLGLNYGYDSGTSQATPFVTGIIALEAAANPSASAAQLKAALLGGVTYDPALAATNGVPAKVRTSGVANAYRAVLNVLNPVQGTNTTRSGNWHNYYGYQGADVVGDTTAFASSFVNVTADGGSPVIVAGQTNNPAAPQRASDPTQRVLAYQGAATTETINLDFTDGQQHQTALYLLDADHKRRVETVSLLDHATGQTLSSFTVSNFTKGEYLLWDLQGQVDLVINSVSGGAAYSGLFFDDANTAPATYQGTDATTTGANWRNQYGSQGYYVVGDNNSNTLPPSTTVSSFSISGGTTDIYRDATHDPRALQRTYLLTQNIAAYDSATNYEDVNVTFADTLVHTVTLYVADYNNKSRAERVQVIDQASGGILVQQDLSSFKNGEFVSFAVHGAVTLRVLRTAGPDAVLSGVFFDAPFGENAHFDGTTVGAGGNWSALGYGVTAAYVVGDDFPGLDAVPASSVLSLAGASRGVIASPTRDRRALLKTGTAGTAVEAYAYTTSSMTLSYNPGDLVQHRLTLYFADYENDHRTESITLENPNNPAGPVLAHQVITNFRSGKYLSYDVSGPVLIVINNGASPNAVLSGVFVD